MKLGDSLRTSIGTWPKGGPRSHGEYRVEMTARRQMNPFREILLKALRENE